MIGAGVSDEERTEALERQPTAADLRTLAWCWFILHQEPPKKRKTPAKGEG